MNQRPTHPDPENGSAQIPTRRQGGHSAAKALVGLALAVLFYLMSRANYPLFHSIADMVPVFIAGSVFLVVWNGRQHLDNHYYLFIAIAFLAFALLDFMHLVGNKGMGVLLHHGNLGPTFYIAGRYVLGGSFLLAPLFIKRKVSTVPVFVAYLLVVALVLLSVFHWHNFPATYIEGIGLTPFKVYSDYAVCLMLLGGLGLLLLHRRAFDARVLKLIVLSLVFSIASGLAFTLYTDAFGVMNALGHFLQAASFYLVFLGFVDTVLTTPQNILYRNLKQSNDSVLELNAELETLNLSLSNDIRAREQVEDALRKSEKKLSAIYASMTEGLALHEVIYDASGAAVDYLITDVNPAYERITGLGRSQSIGAKASALYGTGEAPYLDAFAEVASTGVSTSFEVYFLPMKKHFHISVFSPARGAFATTFQDITDRKQAETALRESEERFRLMGDTIPYGAWMADAEGRNTYTSPLFLELIGMTFEQVKEFGWTGKLPPEDAEPAMRRWMECVQTGRDWEGEMRFPSPDGQWHTILSRGRPVRDAQGQIKAWVGINLDITERKQAEEALFHSQQAFRALAENAPDIIARYDRQLRHLFVNRRVEEVTGFAVTDYLGRTNADLGMPRNLCEKWEALTLEVFSSGTEQKGEFVFPSNHGPIYYDMRLVPEFAPDGSVETVISVARDITDRKQAEEALKRSEERLRLAQESATVGIWDWRIEAGTVELSPELSNLYGLPPESIRTYQEWRDRMHPDDMGRIETLRDEAIARHEPFELEFRGRHSSGEYRWISTKGGAIYDDAGKAIRVLGVNIDITNRKRAEEDLQQLNETLEQRVAERTAEVQQLADHLRALATELTQAEQRERKRLASILHDHIQQLLVAARIQLSLLGRATPATIPVTVQRVDGILKEALDASQSLTVELSPPILHEAGLVGGLNWLASRALEKNQFEVVVRAENRADPPTEDARLLLFECVRELLLNAVKHSGVSQAHVTLLRTNDGFIKLIISDEGRGFDPSLLRNRRPGQGSFGLFSIQQRLAHMNGRMEIATAPGKGTRITLTIPVGDPPTHPDEPGETARREERIDRSRVLVRERTAVRRVLIVDDHRLMREGLARLLGCEPDIEVVAQAADGPEAIALAGELVPDVVLMDVQLGQMSGVEATRRILAADPEIRVIGLSMHADPGVANAMRDAGAVAYLSKGGPSEDLIEAIRTCCRGETAAD